MRISRHAGSAPGMSKQRLSSIVPGALRFATPPLGFGKVVSVKGLGDTK